MYQVQGTHYFYWRLDLYKFNDFEPVRVYRTPESVIVVSRYHWHVLVVWTEPALHEGKPTVGFTRGVHTPIVCCTRKPRLNVVQLKDEPLDTEEDYWLRTVELPFIKQMKGRSYRIRPSRMVGYSDKLVDEDESAAAVTGDYLLDVSKMKVAVVMGKMPLPEDTGPEIRDALYGDSPVT